MPDPTVSIVILNFNHPETIDICLRSLADTEASAAQLEDLVGYQRASYEVVVVDNGSDAATLAELREHRDAGRITTLVENPTNGFFSEGNNIGVRHTNPASEYILLLNSDVAVLRPGWLDRLLGWMEGTAEYRPAIWGLKPTVPTPGPRDIVSAGWSHDANIEGRIRPEGWCCLFRRSVWRELSPDFPWHYGFEEAVALSVRAGARCGVLFNYAPYMVHREGGSGKTKDGMFQNLRTPDLPGWFAGLTIESLDFTLGVDEHSSYLDW